MNEKYENYGDRNFFEYGRLVMKNREDPENKEYNIIFCDRVFDTPGDEPLYNAGVVTVDINDSWIDHETVQRFAGVSKEDIDSNPVLYALDVLSYYGPEEFQVHGLESYYSDWKNRTKEQVIKDMLSYVEAGLIGDGIWSNSIIKNADENEL